MKKAIFKKGLILYFLFHLFLPLISKSEIENNTKSYNYDLIGLIYYLSLKNEALEISKSFKTQNTFKGKIGIFEIKDNKINHLLNFYQINNGKLIEIF